MFKLKEGQHRTILSYDDKYYTCIYDSNNELVSYEDMPYLYVNEEGYETIDVDKFNKNLKSILEYDFLSMAKHVKRKEDYTQLVHKFESFLYTSHHIMSLTNWMINDGGWDDEMTKEFFECCKTMMQKMLYNEDIFKQLSKQVPGNWAYAMFEGSSWTREPWLTTHRIASGQTEFYASEMATNLARIQSFSDGVKQKSMDEFICLQKAVKDNYGWIPKKVIVGEKELEVDDIQEIGKYYAIKGVGEPEYYLADSLGRRVSDVNFENSTVIKYISTSNNIDYFEMIGKKKKSASSFEEDIISKRILSVVQQDTKVTSTLTDYYANIEIVNNGFICQGKIHFKDDEFVINPSYQYIESVMDSDGELQLKQSQEYQYMALSKEHNLEERRIYVQTEEYQNYHCANIENGEITSLEETDKATINIGRNKYDGYKDDYRDTLGRVDTKQKESSKQFVKYYSDEIGVKDLDERCFGDPVFTTAVLEIEKKKLERQIAQTQDEQVIEELLIQAEQIKQEILEKQKRILDRQKQEEEARLNAIDWMRFDEL